MMFLKTRLAEYGYIPNVGGISFPAGSAGIYVPDGFSSPYEIDSRGKMDANPRSSLYDAKLINEGGRIKKSGQGKRAVLAAANAKEDIKVLTYVTTHGVSFDGDIKAYANAHDVILRKWITVYNFDPETGIYRLNVFSDGIGRFTEDIWSDGVIISPSSFRN